MKKRNLFALAAATMLFAACSDDLPNGEGGNGLEGDAWLSLNISPSMTRAINNPDQEIGKADESKVNSIKVVLFDDFASTAFVTNVVDLTLLEDETDWLTKTNAFKVSKNAKSILVIVNPSSKLPTITAGVSTFSSVNQAISATVANVTQQTKEETTTTDNFMMTNASGFLEPNTYASDGKVTNGDIQDNTKATAAAAEAADARLSIVVDRVVAKVRLYNNATSPENVDTPSDDSGIKITFVENSVQWGLNITNKKFYPMSERTKTELNTDIWSATPYKQGSYRKDPNYDDVNQAVIAYNSGVLEYTDAYKANYNFVDGDVTNNSFEITWKSPTNVTNGSAEGAETPSANIKTNVEYCLENTQAAKFNYHAYTTQAVLKATVYPSHFKLAELKDGSYYQAAGSNPTYDWIKIANGYYTMATLGDWIKKELTLFYSDGTVGALYTAFNDYLGYLEGKNVTGVEKVSIPAFEEGDVAADKAATVAALFTDQASALSTHGGDSYGNVTYYAAGVSYYKIMIKHDDDTPEGGGTGTNVNELGEFGVVRNSVYDIHISGINSPGYPIVPKPDPETPDEESDKYLAVQITINPWTWYTQTEEL